MKKGSHSLRITTASKGINYWRTPGQAWSSSGRNWKDRYASAGSYRWSAGKKAMPISTAGPKAAASEPGPHPRAKPSKTVNGWKKTKKRCGNNSRMDISADPRTGAAIVSNLHASNSGREDPADCTTEFFIA